MAKIMETREQIQSGVKDEAVEEDENELSTQKHMVGLEIKNNQKSVDERSTIKLFRWRECKKPFRRLRRQHFPLQEYSTLLRYAIFTL